MITISEKELQKEVFCEILLQGSVAQLVEQETENFRVSSSILLRATSIDI